MKAAGFSVCALVVLETGEGSICADHALAIMALLREENRIRPMLVCLERTSVHERALAAGFDVVPLKDTSRWNPGTEWRLRQVAGLKGRLLIHAFGDAGAVLGCRLASRCRNATLTHSFLMRPPRPDTRRGRVLLDARHMLCGTETIRCVIAEACGEDPSSPAGRKRLVPFSPGISPVSVGGRKWRQGDRFVFAMGNSLVRGSGALMTVRAMSALWQREDIPQWEIRMIGEGDRYGEVFGAAEQLGVVSRLCLLAEQELADVLPGIHVWLVPGNANVEPPMTLGAGIAAGIPVVCSRSPLHLERLRDRMDAVQWVNAQDPQGLAGVMIDVMTNDRLREDLSRRSAQAGRWMDLESAARKAVALFDEWGAGGQR
jgi:hypothetical protein